jgi:hypothetical protein
MRLSIPAVCLSLIASACAQPDLPETAPPPREGCGEDHERVGETATLVTRAHGVMGIVRAVDNCTLELEEFHFDGGGVDVRAVVSPNGDFANGIVLTEDLRRSQGYADDHLQLNLPVGVTLDDVGSLSIWCVAFGVNFADANFL